MSKVVREALASWTSDESVVRRFLSVWPLVENILEAFSRATRLPIFVFMNGKRLFSSSLGTMPPFCHAMLSHGRTASLCVADGIRRAEGAEPEVAKDLQLCHAGMLNGRKDVDLGHLGVLTVLYGSRKATDSAALERRSQVIEAAGREDAVLGRELAGADESSDGSDSAAIREHERGLMDAISQVLRHLFEITVGFHWLSVNMAHELSNLMLGSGLMAKDLDEELREPEGAARQLASLRTIYEPLLTENRLGLYVVRNFLSHVSETRYGEVVPQKLAPVNLRALLKELVDLHARMAAAKGVGISLDPQMEVPPIHGIEQELRRAIHNVLSNAVKYSYRSLPKHVREIKIWSKVPYDPGFRRSRFSIVFQNYGLGVGPDELDRVTVAGFRGRQAIAEVPIGSGIGLSEVKKIMKVHGGDLKLRSLETHKDEEGRPTYLTEVELIFPFNQRTGMDKRPPWQR